MHGVYRQNIGIENLPFLPIESRNAAQNIGAVSH